MNGAGPGGERTGPVAHALRRFVRVEPGETRALLWSAAYFFFLLFSYYLIRPLRDALGAANLERLALFFLGTLAGTLVTNPIFAALVARVPRRTFIPVVYHVFAACLVVFYLLLGNSSKGPAPWVAPAYFVWVTVFNKFVVSVFWGFMVDLYRSEQGKRLFAFIGGGGTLGAIAGAASAAWLADRMNPALLLLLSAALLEACVIAVGRLVRIFGLARRGAPRAPDVFETVAADGSGRPDPFVGIRLLARSRYLLGISAFTLLATVGATFIYFQQAGIAVRAFPDPGERTAFFARIDLYVNLLAATFQFSVTGRLLAGIGVGATLAIFPLLTAGSSVVLSILPAATAVMAVQALRRGAEYGIAQPARELLFTVVRREEKYVSKNLIDTFVFRAGDAVAAGLRSALDKLQVSDRAVSLALVPFAILWAVLALSLGRRHAALARGRADAPGAPP